MLVLLGGWELEPMPRPPEKLLLLRFPGIGSSMTDEEVTDVLALIRSISGRRGYEFTRSCGSSGLVTDQTDRDLLVALRDCPSALPRKAGASKITRGSRGYFVTYRRTTEDNKEEVVTSRFFPPKIGGPFLMEVSMMQKHPVLYEMTCCKALAVMVILALNKEREEDNLQPVALHQVEAEWSNIQIAAKHFREDGRNYLGFVCNYNLFNKFSLVCHPSCYHNDHFRVKSLENKMLLVDYELDGYGSRGGSQLGNHYCFALLDWGQAMRHEKGWFKSHAAEFGLNPNARLTKRVKESLPVGGQLLLDQFLASKGVRRSNAADQEVEEGEA